MLSFRRVVPGGIENSLLYHRLVGDERYGSQMPPSGPLRSEQINIIKNWIDQGADWPDALANEADLPPLSAQAIAMVEALRTGDRQLFVDHGAEVNVRSNDLRTPLMIAATRPGNVSVVQLLLDHKANPNPNARPATESSPQ